MKIKYISQYISTSLRKVALFYIFKNLFKYLAKYETGEQPYVLHSSWSILLCLKN